MGRFFRLCALIACIVASSARSDTQNNQTIEFAFGRLVLPAEGDWTTPEFHPNIGRISASKLVGPRHSIVAMLTISTEFSNEMAYLLKSQPQSILEQRVHGIREQLDNGRFPITAFYDFTWGYAEAICHGYEVTAQDLAVENDSGQLFEFRAIGLACVVPKYPAYLEFDYSERWDPNQASYDVFKSEAWEYFDSLVLN